MANRNAAKSDSDEEGIYYFDGSKWNKLEARKKKRLLGANINNERYKAIGKKSDIS